MKNDREQEFDIEASYDPNDLCEAIKLKVQPTEGWRVISIVWDTREFIAFLQRDKPTGGEEF